MPTRYVYTLAETVTPTPTGAAAAATLSVSPIDIFLGYGLLRPLRRDASDFASAGGETLVRSCVGQILGTRAMSERSDGELRWRPEFGSKFHLLRMRKGQVVDEMARIYTREALSRWEPRVTLSNAETSFDEKTRVRTIKATTDVIDRNVPGNNVLLPNVTTSVEV